MSHRLLTLSTSFAFLLALAAPTALALDLPDCGQSHPGRQNRVEDSVKKGDAEIAKKVASHVVKYALQRFDIKDLVSEEDIAHAKNRIYAFLKWKLGSPSAVCGQWVSSGYGHFDKAYSDEAGALLLGIFKFEDKDPEILFPEWLQATLVAKAATSGPAIAALLSSYGVPEALALPIGNKIAAELAKATERNTVGYYLPKEFDFDNRLITVAIAARRAHEAAQAAKAKETKGKLGSSPVKTGTPPAKGGTQPPPPPKSETPPPKKRG